MKIREFDVREDMYEIFPKFGNGAELGVSRGLNAVQLFHRTKPNQLTLVDKWAEPEGGYKTWDGKMPRWSKCPAGDVINDVRLRFRHEPEVTIVQEDSIDWLQRQKPNSLDWVYIDSMHTYEHHRLELRYACEAVKPGGVIAGHDINWTQAWGLGILRALLEDVQLQRLNVIALTRDQFPSYAARVVH